MIIRQFSISLPLSETFVRTAKILLFSELSQSIKNWTSQQAGGIGSVDVIMLEVSIFLCLFKTYANFLKKRGQFWGEIRVKGIEKKGRKEQCVWGRTPSVKREETGPGEAAAGGSLFLRIG